MKRLRTVNRRAKQAEQRGARSAAERRDEEQAPPRKEASRQKKAKG